MTGEKRYGDIARALVSSFAGEVRRAPSESAHLLSGLAFLLGPSLEIVLSGRNPAALRRAVFESFVPAQVLLHRPPGDAPPVTRMRFIFAVPCGRTP